MFTSFLQAWLKRTSKIPQLGVGKFFTFAEKNMLLLAKIFQWKQNMRRKNVLLQSLIVLPGNYYAVKKLEAFAH